MASIDESEAAKELEKMTALEGLPARVAHMESQLLQFREEVRVEFSATRSELRGEMREMEERLRGEMQAMRGEMHGMQGEMHGIRDDLRSEIKSVGTQMRVLHEELIDRIKLLGER